jgi:cytosine deaminase
MYEMVTNRAACLMRLPEYGLAVGLAADLAVLDCDNRAPAVSEVISPIMAFKAGRRTFLRTPATMEDPPH